MILTNFLTKILSELDLAINYDNASSPDFWYVFIEDRFRNEVSQFEVEKNFLINDPLDEDQKEKLKTLFYNGTWPNRNTVVKGTDVIGFIDSNYPPDIPFEKQERVLDFFRSLCKFDGDNVSYQRYNPDTPNIWRKAYVENEDEFLFYFESLVDAGFLTVRERYPSSFEGISLTVTGLNKLVSLDEKKRSKTCFVAMSFSEEMKAIYEQAIAPAIRETGFDPLKVDDNAGITNEQTINDAILAGIKKARFTIADFTKHRAGVYFEAGYALGRGHKVIYTCREDEIKNAHFDTRNYPHLLWKDAEDLKKKLIDKIEVFIKS